jgi:hypothetical protein
MNIVRGANSYVKYRGQSMDHPKVHKQKFKQQKKPLAWFHHLFPGTLFSCRDPIYRVRDLS